MNKAYILLAIVIIVLTAVLAFGALKLKTGTGGMCIQVITPAASPTGECRDFPTPCDIPFGWKKVESCLK